MFRWWKRVTGFLLACMLCMVGAGCNITEGTVKKKTPYFGTSVSQWNPLVIYAQEGDERYFARDPSLISMVVSLFDEMQLDEGTEDAQAQGIHFTIATMRGTADLGWCDGESVWRCGRRYGMQKEERAELQRLFSLIRAESEGVTAVSKEQLLAVTADTTYQELLEQFGETFQTAVVGAENAFLYQYDGEPFYITFDQETDPVGVAGEQLLKDIKVDYHLTGLLTEPEPLSGGRGGAYEAAFRLAVRLLEREPEDCRLSAEDWPFTDQQEQAELQKIFSGGPDAPQIGIEAYYYMAEEEMWLRISCGETGSGQDIMVKKSNGAWTAALLV